MAILQAFHSAATLALVIGSLVVGIKLLGLARRTGQRPELLLGGAILCTGGIGYGFLIAAFTAAGGAGATVAPDQVPYSAVVLAAIGRVVHNFGVSLYLVFVVSVFRPRARWAWGLAGVAGGLLWLGFAVGVAQGGLRFEGVGSVAWFSEQLVIWLYPVWNGFESFRYWALMRRRAAFGLADPLVTNRFLLWGTGSISAALAIWTASLPFAFMADTATLAAITPPIRVLTAAFGLVAVSCSFLAFLPPTWYRRRVLETASAVGRAATT
ncbi:MAG TPA: hypothetical protein VMW35_14605 [Myxococcota bacterium]|nr:hypothetical protein [Myxococcota bacterium]